MNPSPTPENEPQRALPDVAAPAHLPLRGEPPLRGEIFDIELDENGEAIGQTPGQKRAGAWFFAGLAALFCAYNVGASVGQKSKTPAPIGPFTAQTEKLAPLRVQIAGRVKKPGVYSLPGGARVEDALKTAGGALPNADLSGLNLADWAADGSKIEIPARQSAKIEATPTPIVVVKEVFVTPPQNASAANPNEPRAAIQPVASPNEAAISPKAAPKARAKAKVGKSAPEALALLHKNPIDLNRANAEQLAVLPGVGPKMAERIVAYRSENGGFKAVADLDNVKGIGEKRMTALKDLVKVK